MTKEMMKITTRLQIANIPNLDKIQDKLEDAITKRVNELGLSEINYFEIVRTGNLKTKAFLSLTCLNDNETLRRDLDGLELLGSKLSVTARMKGFITILVGPQRADASTQTETVRQLSFESQHGNSFSFRNK